MNITLATNTVQVIGANVTDLLGSLSGVVTLILGIILGLWIISAIVEMLSKSKDEQTINRR